MMFRVLEVLTISAFITCTLSIDAHANTKQSWLPIDPAAVKASPTQVTIETNPVAGPIQVRVDVKGLRHESIKATDGNVYDVLNTPDSGEWALKPGTPSIPMKSFLIEIPNGVDPMLQNVKSTTKKLGGLFNLYPQQPPEPEGYIRQVFQKDEAAYMVKEFSPSQWITVSDAGIIRGRHVVRVEVPLLQYSPANREVVALVGMSFTIAFSGTIDLYKENRKRELANPEWDRLMAPWILNLTDVKSQPESYADSQKLTLTTPGANYLIVTPDAFYASIMPLAQWKHRKGLRVIVTQLSDIAANPTENDIKAYIQNAYDTWLPVPQYVLLVGHTQNLPAFDFNFGGAPADYKSDHPYSQLDGADIYPDLTVARLSCASMTSSILDTIVNKILTYDSQPDTAGTWYQAFLSAGYFQDDNNNAYEDRYFMEDSVRISDFLANSAGMTMNTAWHTNSGAHATYYNRNNATFPGRLSIAGAAVPVWAVQRWNYTSPPATQQIFDAFNGLQGIGFVLYRGHGYLSGSGWADPHFTTQNVAQLTNGVRTPVVFSYTCSSGRFSGQPSFAESILSRSNGGAVWVVAGARETASGFNDSLTDGTMDALWPNYNSQYSPSRYPTTTRPSEAVNYGKHYAQSYLGDSDTMQFTWRAFNHFGDPEMRLRTITPVPVTLYKYLTSNGTTYTAQIWAYDSVGLRANLPVFLSDPFGLDTSVISGTTNVYGQVTFSGLMLNMEFDLAADAAGIAPWSRVLGHSADTEGFNWMISTTELNRVASYYSVGGYHLQPGSVDGYSSGSGAQAQYRFHSSDYNPINWIINLSELLRLIQFYNSSGYMLSFGTEDNFAPVSMLMAMAKSGLSNRDTEISAIGVTSVSRTSIIQNGVTVDISVHVQADGDTEVRALGLVCALPDGWSYQEYVSGPAPLVQPAVETSNTLEFAWADIPEFPATITYRVSVKPEKLEEGKSVLSEVNQTILYRTSDEEKQTYLTNSISLF